jgi:hypothetical protein
MSINIILHCRDGIVMGCDSLGSMVQTFLEPGTGTPIVDKSSGQPILRADTNEPIIDIATMRKRNIVINTIGYENKLFPIKDYPVAILSSGLGMISNRCVDDLVGEFAFSLPPYKEVEKEFLVKGLVDNLTDFLGTCYSEHFKSLPKIPAGQNLFFLIGGYSYNKYLV